MRCSESPCQESEVQYDSVLVTERYSEDSRIIQLRKETVLIEKSPGAFFVLLPE